METEGDNYLSEFSQRSILLYQDLVPHKNLKVPVLENLMSNNQKHRNTPLPFRMQAAYSQTELIATSKHMT